MYAIVRTGGKQYRVREGDSIAVEHLDAAEDSEVTLDDILLIDNDGEVTVGTPTVAGASVSARVTRQGRRDKVLVFKYKNKTRRKQLRGHRQALTQLTITSISAG